MSSVVATDFETVIGLEIHVELSTASKMFCGCRVAFGGEPNSRVCPVCLGLPGSLPVANEKAIESTLLIGLALQSEVGGFTQFHRKNYFYPDMPKNYQISQFDLPLCRGGHIDVRSDRDLHRVGITRVHLEEDTGKLIHVGETGRIARADYSLVDFNRAGTPLAEIVTEPDIPSPSVAKAFMQQLRNILRHLGVSDCNMEEGSMRCDANVSVRPVGHPELGVKTEIKNMNSFRALQRALEFEVIRHQKVIETGDKVVQETRHWDDTTASTTSMRSKEESHDYRYFPDPDLVPLDIDETWVEKVGELLPELPAARARRFQDRYGMSEQDSDQLTSSQELGDFFEASLAPAGIDPKSAANWIVGELSSLLNSEGRSISESPVSPGALNGLVVSIGDGVISGKMAKGVLEEMYRSGTTAAEVIEEKGLVQISDEGALEAMVDQVMSEHSQAVEEYRSGKKQALGFLVGQVMKASSGKANPGGVNKLLKRKLG